MELESVWVKSVGIPCHGTPTDGDQRKDGEESLHSKEWGRVERVCIEGIVRHPSFIRRNDASPKPEDCSSKWPQETV